jgi:truncated hemoglobin YjbI
MEPEHFEMWLGCFNRSMVAHILPPDVADKMQHCFQSLTSAMQIRQLPRMTSPEAVTS